jgi:hypothetical protein
VTADHPTRSPDSPDPGHGLLHCHRCGKCICPLHEAIADDTWTEARRLCASCFDGPPRSPDSVRTPDFDVREAAAGLLRALDSYEASWMTSRSGYGEVSERKAELRAALHPASPPQEGEK